jgi:hypothetical protein
MYQNPVSSRARAVSQDFGVYIYERAHEIPK